MASHRQIRIPVEFDAGNVEIVPVTAASPRADEFRVGGGVVQTVRRLSRAQNSRRSETQSRARRKYVEDAYRTDSPSANRCGRFIGGTASEGQPSAQAGLLPA